MSFIAYFLVLIFAAGAALFGLDVLTAPLPPHGAAVNVANAPNKLAQREAAQRQMDEGGKRAALTPVYSTRAGDRNVRVVDPANPATRAETNGAAPATQQTAQSAQTAQPALSANQTVAVQPSPLQADQTANDPALRSMLQPTVNAVKNFSDATATAPAKTEPPAAPPSATQQPPAAPSTAAAAAPAAQAATQPAAGACNVTACAAAYQSFRAADCTYQPFDGPRRACVAPPTGQRVTQRAQPQSIVPDRSGDRDRELDSVAAKVKQVTSHRSTDPMDDDEDDDTDDAPQHSIILQQPRWFR